MKLTKRIETEPEIVVFIDSEDGNMVRQPHHPEAEGLAPWATEGEASAWADEFIAETEAQIKAAEEAAKAAAKAAAEEASTEE